MAEKNFYGFLAMNQTETKDGYWLGIFVLDDKGVPVEFRVTYPVKPTLIQRTLYGDALEAYIGVELCGKPLLNAIDHKIQLLSVNADQLLGVREVTACPVVFVSKAGQVIEVSLGDSGDQPNRIRLESDSNRFQPITISTQPGYPEDLQSAESIAQELFANIDLTEPFERIAEAMNALAAQDKKFQ